MHIPWLGRGIAGWFLAVALVSGLPVGCAPDGPSGNAFPETPAPTSTAGAPAPEHSAATSTRHGAHRATRPSDWPDDVPAKVATVLESIDRSGSAPDGYVGGRPFHNLGRAGEQSLPRTDRHGRPVSYQEWDVNPKVAGVNRGAQRLVTGSDGSAYYTGDHYRTFQKIR